MKNIPKILLSVLLAVALAFSFSSCSKSVELTEENVIETVAVVEESLKKFDTKKLEKCVRFFKFFLFNADTLRGVF